MTEQMKWISPPDTFCGGTIDTFRFSPGARAAADEVLASTPVRIFASLMRDQESEGGLLAAKQVLDATLAAPIDDMPGAGQWFDPTGRLDLARLETWVRECRATVAGRLAQACALGGEAREVMLRERAAIALLAGCWLDTISQPATQPAGIVNDLFAHYWRLQGEGRPGRSVEARRRRLLEQFGVYLPPVGDPDFPREAGMGARTALHAAFLLSLSRYPVNYLPEVVGIHYASHVMACDSILLGEPPLLAENEIRSILGAYVDLLGASGRSALERRVARAVSLGVALEVRHAGLLVAMAEHSANQTLDGKVADIIRRHAPFAGKQHRQVKVGGKLLSQWFADPTFDIAAFLADFRQSWHVRTTTSGNSRFIDALKLGGPMFGVFSEREARVLRDWIARISTTKDAPIVVTAARPDEGDAAAWLDSIRREQPAGVVFETAGELDERALFYRLVNIENFPHSLPRARQRAAAALKAAQVMFSAGADGRYTDATFFPYSPDALMARVDAIYWRKLVDPYAPLQQIPSRDDVIFGQKMFALGSLIDGSWVFRIGNAGRHTRASDSMLLAIYADEMGMGDVRKNHITLIHRVLASMGIVMPHIREASFIDQDEIPDEFYAFPINQLCLGLFADSFYPEIVGYNLGIEMFGLGELRLHEIQKLRHWNLDPIYEEAHLSIDNVSAGHAHQAATIIQSYLGQIERQLGQDAVAAEWRRIWNGYALFAYFTEGYHLRHEAPAVPPLADERTDVLMI